MPALSPPKLPQKRHGVSLCRVVICAIVVAPLALVGCDRKPDVVTYTTTVDPEPPPPVPAVAPPGSPMASPPVLPAPDPATLALAWDVPDGWTDTGRANQFRVTTLAVGEGDGRVEVAVSRVAGPAGRMTDNVNRWRQQLGLAALTENEVVGQVDYARNEALPVFQTDQQNDGRRFLIAWFTLEDESWFFKADGPPPAIDEHRAGFETLIASVRRNEPDMTGPAPDDHAAHPDHDHHDHDHD